VGTSTSAAGEQAFIWTKQTGIVDLSSADSAALGVVFMEVHAINARDQIGVMRRSAHDYMMSSSMPAEDNQICAPAPPSSFAYPSQPALIHFSDAGFCRIAAGLLLSRSSKANRVCGIYSGCANLVISGAVVRP
jgi:hypothetical protein